MKYFPYFVTFLVLQRIAELVVSSRNESWLRKRGAYEVGQRHYPLIVALHVAFFVSLILEVLLSKREPAGWWRIPFSLFVAAQVLRYWSIAALGRRWSTKILILPQAQSIQRGPYRFLHHPNYVAVAVELLVIPLLWQAFITAVIFALLNLLIMSVRIPTEEKALSGPSA